MLLPWMGWGVVVKAFRDQRGKDNRLNNNVSWISTSVIESVSHITHIALESFVLPWNA